MRSITFWRSMMASAVQIEARNGTDAYGNPAFLAPVSYRAHLSRQRQQKISATGQQVVSQQSIHIDSSVNVLPNARITLSTGDVGSTESWAIHPIIQAVERAYDRTGAHHTVIYL